MGRSNTAYNISRQTNEESYYVPRMKVIEGTAQKSAPKELTKPQILKLFLVAAAVVSIVAVIINLRVRLTELSGEIDSKIAVLSAAEIEQEEILSQLNSADKLSYFESYAKEDLGMSKLESYQVKYIYADKKDTIKIGTEEPSFFDKTKDFAKDFLEYIKG